jgi:hypothetical protein
MKPFRTLLIVVTVGLGMAARSAEVPAPPTASPSSACQQKLTPDFVLMHGLPPITGPGTCGAEDVVSLEAVLLKDGEHIALAPPATLRCPMAEAVARWIREEVAPAAAATFGSSVRTVITGTSYQCRGRDRDPAAKISEHGHANALDLLGLKLANGTVVNFTDSATRKDFRENVRQSACATFTTVLGPGSDSYHENHIHLDLIERHGGYRLCQWDVRTLPEVSSAPRPPQRPRTSRKAN